MEPHLVVQSGDVGVVRRVAVTGLPCVVHLFRGKQHINDYQITNPSDLQQLTLLTQLTYDSYSIFLCITF